MSSGEGQCLCLTSFIWRWTSNPKCHVTILKTKLNINWHLYFIPKCNLNFGLHNILGKLIFWIINMQFWFAKKIMKKKYQSSISILWSRMFLQMLKMVAQSIAKTSSPQRKNCIRTSRVFKFNLLCRWLLIAFCLEDPLSHCLALFTVSLTISDHMSHLPSTKEIARAKLNLSM